MLKIILFLYNLKKQIQEKYKNNHFYQEIFVTIPKKITLDKERKQIIEKEIENFYSKKETPLFETIEIETINRCNGECAFCPINRHDDTREYKKMDENLFKNIIHQLVELNYDGRLQIFSNNEPLMDKRIFDFVKYAKENLPKSHMSFFTNGTLLNDEKFDKLIPYCDTFCIDIYYKNDEKIPENIKNIIKKCEDTPELKKKVIIQMINQQAIRNNRGGQSKNRLFTYKLKSSCLLPYKQVIIRPDGKLSLCCNDPKGVYTLGDLNKNLLFEIWSSNTYKKIREKLFHKGRKSIKLCEYCDNFGGFGTNSDKNYIFTPAEFSTKWEKIEKVLAKEKESKTTK